jgi:hypothetical protein
LLKCPQTKNWKEERVNSKRLNINEDIAYRKIIGFTNVIKIKSIGKYIFKTKCKLKDKVRGRDSPPLPPRLGGS